MRAEADSSLIVYFNGDFVPLRDARVGILTHALNYGTGVFEGIRAYWDEPSARLCLFRPLDHYRRWQQNCGILRIDLAATPEQLCEITVELLRRNEFRSSVYIRPLAYKSAERVGVSPDDQSACAIVALPFGDYLPSDKGIHAGVSSWRRVEDNAIPARAKICGAYVNSALASDDARRSGFDEAILLNESGRVAEGSTCNLFMVRRGALVTPPAAENILEGITRDCVIELAQRELGIAVIERPISRSELYVCDELFLTGTAVGVVPVVRVDHRTVREGSIGAITRGIRSLYFDAALGRLRAYRNWIVPVRPPQQEAEPASLAETSVG